MKRLIFIILLLFIGLFATCHLVPAQSLNKIAGRCTSPYQLLYSYVEIAANGDINYKTCGNRTHYFTGNVDFSGATITGAVTGTGTTNFVPIWTGTNTLSNSVISQVSGKINFGSDASGVSFGYFDLPNNDFYLANTLQSNYVQFVSNTGQFIVRGSAISLDSIDGSTQIGDVNGIGNSTALTVNDGAGSVTLAASDTNVQDKLNIKSTSSCAGSGTIGVGGTVNVSASCVTDDSIILVTYTSATVRVKPITVSSKTSGVRFTVIGDASAEFNYWIINRY